MDKKRLTVLAALMLALPLVFGGAAFAAQDAYGKVSKELYAKAKKEGGLVAYTVWDVEHIRAILDAFSKRFPGIKTSYWQGRNPEIVTRVLTEFRAGQPSVDVILSDNAPPPLRAAGAISPYETVQKDHLVIHDPTMPVVSMQIQVLTYNTKRLKARDVPKTWEDVASPKYKGIVALDDPLRAGPLTTMLAALKDHWKNDARWTKFVKGLKALDVPVHRSTSALFRLVIAGEYSIAMPALYHDVVFEMSKGSPVNISRTAPPVLFPRYSAIYVKAPHPNTARLFSEWLISPDGQAALDSVGRETARKGFKAKASLDKVFPPNVQTISPKDQSFLEDPKAWVDKNLKPIWK